MYTPDPHKKKEESVYIPSNYRGNALYFERIASDPEQTCESRDSQKEQPCPVRENDHANEPAGKRELPSAPSLLSRFFGGDSLLILAVAAFLLFAGRDGRDGRDVRDGRDGKDADRPKQDDNTLLLLLLLLLT